MSSKIAHSKKRNSLIPELRFKEFSGEWNRYRLGDFTKINQGLQIAITERFTEKVEGSYFYITNEFLKKDAKKNYFIKNPPSSVLCEETDLLMTRTGNTGQVVTGVKGAFHNNFFKIKLNDDFDRWFLYYFLTSHQTQHTILTLAGTSTIPDLNHGDFYKIRIKVPSYLEQQKIASFLSAVDEKIQQLTRKKELLEQYKKGVMQQLFSRKLRFKDENGKAYPKWTQKRLGQVTHKVDKKNKDNSKYPIYSINNYEGFTPQADQFDGVDSHDRGYDISLYKIIYPKTFAYNPARINVGSIGYSGDLNKILISSLYVCFQTTTELDDLYLLHFLKTNWFNNSVLRYAEGGVRQYLFYENFSLIKIPVPSLNEQRKIANFLSVVDTKIEGVYKVIEQAKTFKKGLLQQMFV